MKTIKRNPNWNKSIKYILFSKRDRYRHRPIYNEEELQHFTALWEKYGKEPYAIPVVD